MKCPAFSLPGWVFLQSSNFSRSLEQALSIWLRKTELVVRFNLNRHKTCSQVSEMASNCSGFRSWAHANAAKSFWRSSLFNPQLKVQNCENSEEGCKIATYLFDKAKMSLWQAGWLTNKPEPGTADFDGSSSFCAEMAFKPKMAKKTKMAGLWGFDIIHSFTDMSTLNKNYVLLSLITETELNYTISG